MTRTALQIVAVLLVFAPVATPRAQQAPSPPARTAGAATRSGASAARAADLVLGRTRTILADDLAALQARRPGYPFWQHIFAIPDGSIAFGSAADGRLLAVLPVAGDWTRTGRWLEPAYASVLAGQALPASLGERRDRLAALLAHVAGPIVHNPTRGDFVGPNARRYGGLLAEWGRIYERFGIPPLVGLAQALVESGLSGTVRSEARATGFCQWLPGNWKGLEQLAGHPIESRNQTTQASYCAAYLAVLMTKYGSLIPALSDHHAGGTNVGRTIINGARLGGDTVRNQYFLGSQFARDLRLLAPGDYRDLYGTYGPRSFAYAEMVFGNAGTVHNIQTSTAQRRIYAYRTPSALTLVQLKARTGVSAAELQTYNPALVTQLRAGADVYLPKAAAGLGANVAFWHRDAPASYLAVLADFLRLEVPVGRWDEAAFLPALHSFASRFRATGAEEGAVMATVLAYVVRDIRDSGRGAILTDFRTSPSIARLFSSAISTRESLGSASGATER